MAVAAAGVTPGAGAGAGASTDDYEDEDEDDGRKGVVEAEADAAAAIYEVESVGEYERVGEDGVGPRPEEGGASAGPWQRPAPLVVAGPGAARARFPGGAGAGAGAGADAGTGAGASAGARGRSGTPLWTRTAVRALAAEPAGAAGIAAAASALAARLQRLGFADAGAGASGGLCYGSAGLARARVFARVFTCVALRTCATELTAGAGAGAGAEGPAVAGEYIGCSEKNSLCGCACFDDVKVQAEAMVACSEPPPALTPFARETDESDPWSKAEVRALFRALIRSGKVFALVARAVSAAGVGRSPREVASFYYLGWRQLPLRQALRDRTRKAKKVAAAPKRKERGDSGLIPVRSATSFEWLHNW